MVHGSSHWQRRGPKAAVVEVQEAWPGAAACRGLLLLLLFVEGTLLLLMFFFLGGEREIKRNVTIVGDFQVQKIDTRETKRQQPNVGEFC